MYRTRFAKNIVAEFLPPLRATKRHKVIILCDGMPSIPRKQPFAEFLAGKGYWVIYPRYRGAWESGGVFLARSPHLDILDVIAELPSGLRDAAFGKTFALSPSAIYVIGGSFGGPSALLCSLDPRVTRVVANCPVVDWSILSKSERAENVKCKLCRIHSRSFRQWLPDNTPQLGQAPDGHVLQPHSSRA